MRVYFMRSKFAGQSVAISSRGLRVPTKTRRNLARRCTLLIIGENDAMYKQKSLAFAVELG
jgi:hypothetical protein